MDRRLIGQAAEDHAAGFLEALGWSIIARNARSKLGELDLVARDGETVVFVEVRARGPGAWVTAAASVDREKARRVLRAARWFAQARGLDGPMRIDVIAIQEGRLEHVINALPGY